jgi:hypothetical protein
LEIEISCSQWEGWVGGRGEEDFFHFSFVPKMFLSNSQWVPIRFPICLLGSQCAFPSVFPIASCFNPICFARSPPLLTYIAGPKGEALHLYVEASILGSLHSFNFVFLCFFGMGSFFKLARCKKKGVGLVKHPQILYINSLGLSVCLSEPVHFDLLTVSVRPILQPLDDINDVSKGCRDVK